MEFPLTPLKSRRWNCNDEKTANKQSALSGCPWFPRIPGSDGFAESRHNAVGVFVVAVVVFTPCSVPDRGCKQPVGALPSPSSPEGIPSVSDLSRIPRLPGHGE